jgi:hypothetical protein
MWHDAATAATAVRCVCVTTWFGVCRAGRSSRTPTPPCTPGAPPCTPPARAPPGCRPQASGSQAGGSQAGGSQAGGSQAGGSQAGGSEAGGSQADWEGQTSVGGGAGAVLLAC